LFPFWPLEQDATAAEASAATAAEASLPAEAGAVSAAEAGVSEAADHREAGDPFIIKMRLTS
jgi:hypothetical protein